LDDLFREPLLNRRFQAQDTAATCARYLFTGCEDLNVLRSSQLHQITSFAG